MFKRPEMKMSQTTIRLQPPEVQTPTDPRERARPVESALRIMHALEEPLAVETIITPRRSSLLITVRRGAQDSLKSILLPAYRDWSLEEFSMAPPHWAASAGVVGEILPSGGALDGPYPSAKGAEVPLLSPWEGFLRLPRVRGMNLWTRMILSPRGSSLAHYLPSQVDENMETPRHTIGKRMLDLRTERVLDLNWSARGILLLWPEHVPAGGSVDARDGRRRMSRLVEALSSLPGGRGFQLKWARTVWGREKLVTRYLSANALNGKASPFASTVLLSTAETASWLPPIRFEVPSVLRNLPAVGMRAILVGTEMTGVPIVLPWSKEEGHHLLIAGETGMGKSTLLTRLASQVLDGKTSLILLDPLGDTVLDVLSEIGEESLEHALYIAPRASPVSQNALSLPIGLGDELAHQERERLVGELVTAFRRARAERYGETFYWGPRIEDLLTRVFLFLSYSEGATLEDAEEILSDPRNLHLPFVKDGEGNRRMRDLLLSLQGERLEEMEGARRVVHEVTLSHALSNLLSSRSPRWDLSHALEPGKVTLISMERAEIGSRAASYLGSVLLSLIWSRIVGRGRGCGKVVMVLDEIQEYANDSLSEMLRLGRRYNLHVWAATQSLSGLPRDLRDGLLTNSRDIVLFRGSPSDALLARENLGLSRGESLLSLGRGMALAFQGKASSLSRVRVSPPTLTGETRGRVAAQRLRTIVENSRPFWSSKASPGSITKESHPLESRSDVSETPDALYAILAGSLGLRGNEELHLPLKRVLRLVGQNERALRALGSLLKSRNAMVRTEKMEGERRWVLTRLGIEGSVPRPWSPERLGQGKEDWERSGQDPEDGSDQIGGS